jgi:hypothetical protein
VPYVCIIDRITSKLKVEKTRDTRNKASFKNSQGVVPVYIVRNSGELMKFGLNQDRDMLWREELFPGPLCDYIKV